MGNSQVSYIGKLSNQDTSSTSLKFYRWNRFIYVTLSANVTTTQVTIGGSTVNKVCDIPSGFYPIGDAEVRDTLNNKRIVFDHTNHIVHSVEALSNVNIRGSICYMSEN